MIYRINKKTNLQRFIFLNNTLINDPIIFEKNVLTPLTVIVEG